MPRFSHPRRARLGLIEADQGTLFYLDLDTCIRGARASASLKLDGAPRLREHQRWHPRRARLGLIEAFPETSYVRLRRGGIRGARASASLKRYRPRYGYSVRVAASEARAPRPH